MPDVVIALFAVVIFFVIDVMEKANSQAESLEQIGQGIEQLSGVVQGNAASSEENTAISINLAEGAAKMRDRVNIFKLF